MINMKHVLRVTALWVNIAYIVCFAGVAVIPSVRPWFMLYALHTTSEIGEAVITVGTFFSGLVIWNIVALLAVWLFGALYNSLKR